MKRLSGLVVAILCFTIMCTPNHCIHIHSSDCGYGSGKCTHRCFNIQPKQDENPKF